MGNWSAERKWEDRKHRHRHGRDFSKFMYFKSFITDAFKDIYSVANIACLCLSPDDGSVPFWPLLENAAPFSVGTDTPENFVINPNIPINAV